MEGKGRVSVSCGVEKESGIVGLGFTLCFFNTIGFFLCVSLGSKGKREVLGGLDRVMEQIHARPDLMAPGTVEGVPACGDWVTLKGSLQPKTIVGFCGSQWDSSGLLLSLNTSRC